MNSNGAICVIFAGIFIICLYGDVIEIPFSSPYYNPDTKKPLRMTSIENMLVNNTKYATKQAGPLKISQKTLRRVGFRSNGCNCQALNCGCCLGINLNQFNFNREGCMNFTYDPNEFAVNMNMYMNNNNIFSNSFSAKNPPPLCMPIPIPYIPIQVHACARVFNIHTPGSNLHLCLDFETRIQNAAVLVLHFDCIRMGLDGVAVLKPEDGGGLPPSLPVSPSDEDQVDTDIYDEVTEIKLS
ncbi:unnamed protein product [Phaedon cochleariae]|uniref:DUF4773 domain-containing protein n=1 Tax=Phaedon cochleariae TaxID=80249 RepID=A0A9P0GVS6_PHACE|nr:unnamed protein product [Phaedon cochleariae]